MASAGDILENQDCHAATPLLHRQHQSHQRHQRHALQRVAGRQSSLVTVLALWNTMIATSVLSLPWAVKEAGLLCGVLFLILLAGIMSYTCYLVLHSVDRLPDGQLLEFHDVCRRYLGRWAKALAMTGSLVSLVGGMIVNWLLITNFLFHIGNFIYNQIHEQDAIHTAVNSSNGLYGFAVCDVSPAQGREPCSANQSGESRALCSQFPYWWNETRTVPVFLVALLFPLLHFKRATVFTVMNSFGMLSLVYLVVFVAMKAAAWGWNFNPQAASPDRALHNSAHGASQFRWSFPALTGVASLGYFVQNSVLPIVRNQRHPQNNTRDLILAYSLVAVTFIYVGVVFYLSFPLDKNCIVDNLLNNIASDDRLGLAARAGLCFQLTCIFPQLAYITRIQVFTAFFNSPWPSAFRVVMLNTLVVTICVLFAVFLPHIGRILSFVGALCGFYYAIGLPCLVRCVILRQEGRLTCFHIVLHTLLILLGFLNFVAQFFMVD